MIATMATESFRPERKLDMRTWDFPADNKTYYLVAVMAAGLMREQLSYDVYQSIVAGVVSGGSLTDVAIGFLNSAAYHNRFKAVSVGKEPS